MRKIKNNMITIKILCEKVLWKMSKLFSKGMNNDAVKVNMVSMSGSIVPNRKATKNQSFLGNLFFNDSARYACSPIWAIIIKLYICLTCVNYFKIHKNITWKLKKLKIRF